MKNKIISILIIFITIIGGLNTSFGAVLNNEIEKNQNIKEVNQQQSDNIIENEGTTNEEGTEEKQTITIEITNTDKETKLPIKGNIFEIVNKDGTDYKMNLETDERGKINVEVEKATGKMYYLKQVSVSEEYNRNKGMIELKIDDVDEVKVNIENEKAVETEEITTKSKEINVAEDTKKILENNNKEIINIKPTNIDKEQINTTNETNWNNVTYFTNTINRKDITNLNKEYDYVNQLKDESYEHVKNETIESLFFDMLIDRQEYRDLYNHLIEEAAKVPSLPQASK